MQSHDWVAVEQKVLKLPETHELRRYRLELVRPRADDLEGYARRDLRWEDGKLVEGHVDNDEAAEETYAGGDALQSIVAAAKLLHELESGEVGG